MVIYIIAVKPYIKNYFFYPQSSPHTTLVIFYRQRCMRVNIDDRRICYMERISQHNNI